MANDDLQWRRGILDRAKLTQPAATPATSQVLGALGGGPQTRQPQTTGGAGLFSPPPSAPTLNPLQQMFGAPGLMQQYDQNMQAWTGQMMSAGLMGSYQDYQKAVTGLQMYGETEAAKTLMQLHGARHDQTMDFQNQAYKKREAELKEVQNNRDRVAHELQLDNTIGDDTRAELQPINESLSYIRTAGQIVNRAGGISKMTAFEDAQLIKMAARASNPEAVSEQDMLMAVQQGIPGLIGIAKKVFSGATLSDPERASVIRAMQGVEMEKRAQQTEVLQVDATRRAVYGGGPGSYRTLRGGGVQGIDTSEANKPVQGNTEPLTPNAGQLEGKSENDQSWFMNLLGY